MSTPVNITVGSLSPGTCWPDTPQAFVDMLRTLISGSLNENFPGIYSGPTAPPAEFQDRIWHNTTNGKDYDYVNGNWQREYDIPTGMGLLMPWSGSDADLATYGGGSATDPLWEIATDYEGRFLLGAGTIPGTSPAVTTVTGATNDSSGQSGEYQHSLTEEEMPPHVHHFVVLDGNSAAGGVGSITSGTLNKTPQQCFAGDTENAGGISDGGTPPVYTVKPHNTMPPYRAVRWAQRTNRRFVLAPY